MKFETGFALHQCHALSSRHMETKNVIVVYAMGDAKVQEEGEIEEIRGATAVKGDFGIQSLTVGPILRRNGGISDGDAQTTIKVHSSTKEHPDGRKRIDTFAESHTLDCRMIPRYGHSMTYPEAILHQRKGANRRIGP